MVFGDLAPDNCAAPPRARRDFNPLLEASDDRTLLSE
jgi:hypothetical protein